MPEDIPILEDDWRPPVEDWGKVEDDVYKFSFDQAKERFNECMFISDEITNKSQKLLIGFVSFVAAAFSASFKVNIPGHIATVAVVIYFFDILMIIYLLLNKFLPLRGDMPIESFVPQIDDPEICKTKEEQLKLIYFHALRRYNKKIVFIGELNKKRGRIYQVTLISTFILFVSTVIYIVYTIFHP